MNEEHYKIKDGTLVVCAWCHPAATILDRFPELRQRFSARDISHGICQRHKDAMKAEIAAQKPFMA
jgi:hypothetical protein